MSSHQDQVPVKQSKRSLPIFCHLQTPKTIFFTVVRRPNSHFVQPFPTLCNLPDFIPDGIPTLSNGFLLCARPGPNQKSIKYPLGDSRIVRYDSGIGGQSEHSHFAQVQFRNCTHSHFTLNMYMNFNILDYFACVLSFAVFSSSQLPPVCQAVLIQISSESLDPNCLKPKSYQQSTKVVTARDTVRVKSGNLRQRVNSDIRLQTVKIQMRRPIKSRLIGIFTVCLVNLIFMQIIQK